MKRIVQLCIALGSGVFAPTAVGVPTAPTILSQLPEAIPFGGYELRWTAATAFSQPCRFYDVEITSVDTGRTELRRLWTQGDPQTVSMFVGGIRNSFGSYDNPDPDGLRFTYRVRAGDAPSSLAGAGCPESFPLGQIVFPFVPILEGAQFGPFSPSTVATVYDATPPELKAGFSPGQQLRTRNPVVALDVVGSDPVPGPGRRASGLERIVLAGRTIADGRHRVRLDDGEQYVSFLVSDRAGNSVQRFSPSVLVDTRGPKVTVTQASRRVPVGAIASFQMTVTDDVAGLTTAGVRTGSFRWSFGDGRPGAVGENASHIYGRRGTFCGFATASDTVGNVGRVTFSSVVGSPSSLFGGFEIKGRSRLRTIRTCVGKAGRVVTSIRRPGRGVALRVVSTGRPGFVDHAVRFPGAGRWHVVVAAAGTVRSRIVVIR